MGELYFGLYFDVNIMEVTTEFLDDIVPKLRGAYVKDQAVAIVVMDPTDPSQIWFQIGVGDPEERYFANALAKIEAVTRTGLDSGNLGHLLMPDDFPYEGAVNRDDIVVGVSGWAEIEDKFLAECVASFVKLAMRQALGRHRTKYPDERRLCDSGIDTNGWLGSFPPA